ncbi:radical SAM family heme chaperone HemW [Gorillibacterium sp. CAU 1737]|uniref:radical SAM family heme chaperone HemW n=1 Tax=Gorillibacterium sp. CAU 1737 TaxID=3140362 RepID=UPI00326002D2
MEKCQSVAVVDSFLDYREPICLSHYPPLSKSPTAGEASAGLSLIDRNESNHKNATIYIHIPFCDKICAFCPFNKYLKEEKKVANYLKALFQEIDLYADTPFVKDTEFSSIAFGGGTPTALTSEQLCSIIEKCKSSFRLSRDVEIGVEGNPENYTREKMEATFAAGVNRISLGVQTFDPQLTEVMELHHKVEEALEAIQNAHELGCHNVGIDLIYNMPEQTDEQWLADIDKAIELGIEHVCLFSITTPPFTKFKKDIDNGRKPPVGDQSREIYLYKLAEKRLLEAGYEQYSVYDFILPNKVNIHALNYFSRQSELVGLGPSAFGYLNNYMYINNGQLEEYCEQIDNQYYPIIYGEKASVEDEMYGMMAKGLRMLKVSKAIFEKKFNITIEEKFPEQLAYLQAQGLIEIDDYDVKLTRKGRLYGNNVCRAFISDNYKEVARMNRNPLTKGVKRT